MGRLVYEGKSKRVYEAGPGLIVMEFKDEVTAYNGKFRDEAPGKGVSSARLSARLFEVLEDGGVATHYVCYEGGNRIRARRYQVIPIEVTVRNYAYGGMLRRIPVIKPFKPLSRPLVEYHFKSDEHGDPLILEDDIVEADILTGAELERLKELALRVNDILSSFWARRGLKLVDFKIEVGWDPMLGFVVVDEISGDTMRLVDESMRHHDKEIYRRTRDVRAMLESYEKLASLAGPPSRLCQRQG